MSLKNVTGYQIKDARQFKKTSIVRMMSNSKYVVKILKDKEIQTDACTLAKLFDRYKSDQASFW